MEVKYYTEPFKLKELPLEGIHVIDNWCPQGLWDNFLKLVHEKKNVPRNCNLHKGTTPYLTKIDQGVKQVTSNWGRQRL